MLYKHRRSIEAGYFRFRNEKTKALIGFAVSGCEADLCSFVFAYANCLFSHEAAHLLSKHKEYNSANRSLYGRYLMNTSNFDLGKS